MWYIDRGDRLFTCRTLGHTRKLAQSGSYFTVILLNIYSYFIGTVKQILLNSE
jgi:hypothetical protein